MFQEIPRAFFSGNLSNSSISCKNIFYIEILELIPNEIPGGVPGGNRVERFKEIIYQKSLRNLQTELIHRFPARILLLR